ncbi:hypothetical protein RRG08_009999 [Elysia crispata]|uniref:Uncharacterized protein n=1 Tax=Elysia crispata TaxID=231223 RepID=A0AAE0ZV63_9GAST|nr:hypothetical protein RRG08_009999 [Elysia crispata]
MNLVSTRSSSLPKHGMSNFPHARFPLRNREPVTLKLIIVTKYISQRDFAFRQTFERVANILFWVQPCLCHGHQ